MQILKYYLKFGFNWASCIFIDLAILLEKTHGFHIGWLLSLSLSELFLRSLTLGKACHKQPYGEAHVAKN